MINLKIKRPSKKLNYIKIGLFLVKKIKKLINYFLDLLTDIKIYLIFYILLLKSADPRTLL